MANLAKSGSRRPPGSFILLANDEGWIPDMKAKPGIGSSDDLELSKDGRRAIDNGYNPGKVRFFRVP